MKKILILTSLLMAIPQASNATLDKLTASTGEILTTFCAIKYTTDEEIIEYFRDGASTSKLAKKYIKKNPFCDRHGILEDPVSSLVVFTLFTEMASTRYLKLSVKEGKE